MWLQTWTWSQSESTLSIRIQRLRTYTFYQLGLSTDLLNVDCNTRSRCQVKASSKYDSHLVSFVLYSLPFQHIHLIQVYHTCLFCESWEYLLATCSHVHSLQYLSNHFCNSLGLKIGGWHYCWEITKKINARNIFYIFIAEELTLRYIIILKLKVALLFCRIFFSVHQNELLQCFLSFKYNWGNLSLSIGVHRSWWAATNKVQQSKYDILSAEDASFFTLSFLVTYAWII